MPLTKPDPVTLVTADSGEVCLQFQMNGVQQNGVDIGDWVVSVEHIPAGKMN